MVVDRIEEALEEIRRYAGGVGADRVVMLTDSNVSALLPSMPEKIYTMPAGEATKTLETAAKVWEWLVNRGVTRRSMLVCIGGGMVTDLGGFAAGVFKRGIRCAYISTTLLGAVDASLGGKTGVDFQGFKNELGIFREPALVITAVGSFATLPALEFFSGMGEVLKYSLLSDSVTLGMCNDLLENDADVSLKRCIVERCQAFKRAIVEEDPKDHGVRKILNLGHTFGHAFESRLLATGHAMPHGVCVAHGLVAELIASSLYLGFPKEFLHKYAHVVKEQFPRLRLSCRDSREIAAIAMHDKKNLGDGLISYVGLRGVGDWVLDTRLTEHQFEEVLAIYCEMM